MRNQLAFIVILLILSISASAQIADRPEDISPLLISEKLPSVEITSIKGAKIDLLKEISKKPAVLVFYRGGWCPYCNAHLAAIGEIENEITALGYQIMAISPDSSEPLQEVVKEQTLNYSLFSDSDGTLITAMGIAFSSPEKYSGMLSDYSKGKNTGFLPVPSLFVVNTEGTIIFEYISSDYKQRIKAPLLLNVLKQL